MDSKQEEEDPANYHPSLQQVLQTHQLSDEYHTKMVLNGFDSIQMLRQCTERDVDELCAELQLNLLDKLKLKTALKSVNIPKESVQYAVINEQEQNAMNQINESIKKAQDLIIENNATYPNRQRIQNELNAQKQKICDAFDAFHQIINEKKENLLDTLQQNFEQTNMHNQQLSDYLDLANNTKLRCEQLIIHRNEMRKQSVIDLKDECLSKLSQILSTNNEMSICISDNLQSFGDCIDNLVSINCKKAKIESNRDCKGESMHYSESKNDENFNYLNVSQHACSQVQNGQKSFGSLDKSQNFKFSDLSSNNKDDDNCSNISFEPLVQLKEQSVVSGHENEEFLSSFKVKKLYNFGTDVTGQQAWKLRAAQTELSAYKNEATAGRARLVCREYKTEKLRLNHFIPSKHVAKLNCKSDKVIIWGAYDQSIEENYEKNICSMFCAKFYDADSYVVYFFDDF